MSALYCLFLCLRSYSEKLEEIIPTFCKIRYILEELYLANRLIIYVNQLNTGHYLSKIHVNVLLEKGLLHTFSILTFVDVQFLHEFVVLSVIREG